MPRETFVIELNCHEPVGVDDLGKDKVIGYLNQQTKLLCKQALAAPQTHLSPKYGFSGWAPLTGKEGEAGEAIHLYAWDRSDDSGLPPFVSIDFCTSEPIQPSLKTEIIHSTAEYFGARTGELVTKTTKDDSQWRELASDIHRQRLALSGKIDREFTMSSVARYMDDLSSVLKMNQLSSSIFTHNGIGTTVANGWMHWETSGTVIFVDANKNLAMDIYTCKPFTPEDAVTFTRERLKLTGVDFHKH